MVVGRSGVEAMKSVAKRLKMVGVEKRGAGRFVGAVMSAAERLVE